MIASYIFPELKVLVETFLLPSWGGLSRTAVVDSECVDLVERGGISSLVWLSKIKDTGYDRTGY